MAKKIETWPSTATITRVGVKTYYGRMFDIQLNCACKSKGAVNLMIVENPERFLGEKIAADCINKTCKGKKV